MTQIGDNSGLSGERIKSFVKRIEKLEEDKMAVQEDIKDIYAEAKGTGFDTKTIKRIIKNRKLSAEKRREQEELYELYVAAIGE